MKYLLGHEAHQVSLNHSQFLRLVYLNRVIVRIKWKGALEEGHDEKI